ncbi:MAG: DUF2955 domain-containing protein [Gammaproteobacteria bacterium]|nr:DUF2955 domain-containing protein [Gammaproteobacteria bacterium]
MPVPYQASDVATRRILRLALGTSLALWFSQALAWDMSFVAPILALTVLGLPLPALRLKAGLTIVFVLFVALNAGLMLLPVILNYRIAGILLLALALYWSFYFTARGGNPLLGTFATIGIALATAVGSVSLDVVLVVIEGVTLGAIVGIAFVWLAHLLLPDPADGSQAPTAPRPAPSTDLSEARQNAFRSLAIVLPVALWFLLSSQSAAYAAVMIKVASMGQQATNEATREAAGSLIRSTIIGGIAAVIAWQLLRIYPSLALYTLLVALAALVFGRRTFHGAGLHADGETWSYGFMTMIVILAPAVLDSATGASADVKFVDRLLMFAGATLYAVAAVYVFDAFRPGRPANVNPAAS